MGDSFYKRYKVSYTAAEKRKGGKTCLIVSLLMLIGVLVLLPHRADNVAAICGNELKTGDAYYIEDLQILDTKLMEDGKTVYCVAQFTDKNQEDWIISFRPLFNEHLANQISLAQRLGTKTEFTTSGYVYVDDIPSEGDAFYAVRTKTLSDSGETNILKLHADYLCGASGNYTLEALRRPSILKHAFIWGVFGTIYSLFLLFKYRSSKFQS